jgi:hypothetical protein
MEISNKDRETLERRLEEELWREETRFDRQRMSELLANDFFEFGRSGRVYQKQDTLAVTRQQIEADDCHWYHRDQQCHVKHYAANQKSK